MSSMSVPMDRRECLSAAATRAIGRVAVTSEALPAVFPVSFELLDEDVVFRTGAGTTLAAAVRNAVVAFEVDDIDPVSRTGWSVLIVGRAEELTSEPWALGRRGRYVRIRSELVSGRRLTKETRARFAALS